MNGFPTQIHKKNLKKIQRESLVFRGKPELTNYSEQQPHI